MSAWWWAPLGLAAAASGLLTWLSRRLRAEAARLEQASATLRSRRTARRPGEAP